MSDKEDSDELLSHTLPGTNGAPTLEVTSILDKPATIDATRRWISTVVIGLDFCPFAQRVFQGDLIRYVVSDAADSEALRADLADELKTLALSPVEKVETTLLIHPRVLQKFTDYCDFLAEAARLVNVCGYRGVIQVASFHPEYQFANTEADDVENYTNRSPYPMLHLLREESITRIAANPDDLLDIPKRNAAALRSMGRAGMLKLLDAMGADAKERTDAH